ncbi:MAG: DNA mismatch repair protein MutS [Verrucomicrobiae bacterium]|nr:DNA mismatch repair protein MutS [Verrucomicrobiae bacterium]
MSESPLTPMMQQYQRMKREVPADAILLFRLGDFYEMFFDDAKTGAHILNIALTQRHAVPMCGIPYHAADQYISRLIKAGKRVAICNQTEEARPGKLVNRELTQIISPGSVVDAGLLNARLNNFLGAIAFRGDTTGFALVDLTTGEFKLTEFKTEQEWKDEISRVSLSELIVSSEWADRLSHLGSRVAVTIHDGWAFETEFAADILKKHFKIQSLDGLGLTHVPAGIGAAGAVLHYLETTLRRSTSHIQSLRNYQTHDCLVLDSITQRNLELVEPLSSNAARDTSLLHALDRTVTPMGARMLRDWLLRPLSARDPILRRQEALSAFIDNPLALGDLREGLKGVRDLERIIGRLSQGHGNARDLIALKESLLQIPHLKKILAEFNAPLLSEITGQIEELPVLSDLIVRAITDEPPLALKEGGLIRTGYSPALDELHHAARDGKEWVARLQADEQERSGIKSLKIRFNSVFGYYIEVSSANLKNVPDHYIRKQTLVNAERFITPELKEMEGKILGAEERSQKLEYEIFLEIREDVVHHTASIQRNARALATLDALAGLAETARLFNYVRPEIGDGGSLVITEGRHPVLEQMATEEKFIPNDTRLNDSEYRVLVITGPNMAGKSTFIRQVALIALLAHTGAYVPAQKAEIPLLDRIFTRVGANDDLSRGQSTFMVEMNETANILNNATPRSLVILDEIGRGTSTFDGLSIAWAVAEHLHTVTETKTLFATHYHELTELAVTLRGVKNFHVAVREWNDQIIFLRKINAGGTDKSYGIQVGRLAGLPKPVIERAKEILRRLEEDELDESGSPRLVAKRTNQKRKAKDALSQIDMFSQHPPAEKTGNGPCPSEKIKN